MVVKRGKKIELRKRKETEQEKKVKDRQKKKKEFKETLEHLRLNIAILFLIGVNFLFVSSIVCQSLKNKGTDGAITPTDLEEFQFENLPQKLKVEVLNACGTPGVAKELTDYLRQRDVDVVYYGNFGNRNISETLVVDRKDLNLQNAKIIGEILGLEKDRMIPLISPQRQLDVTIYIGRNYSQLKAFQ